MISYNEKHFLKDGKPWFPIMGEYEYSRTEKSEWERGIAKMKALGVNTVQCYSIWLHHEELKGHFNFRGNNNLRAFVRLVKEAGMKMCLRVGPWVHAELRAGGFPDWIFEEDYTPRTNDPRYLSDVRTYFTELYKQCEGYLDKDGGPIFAIQVENELKAGSEAARIDTENYINNLIGMLREIGFDVPVFIATAWGNAITGDALPAWGEYAAAPWEQHADPLPANEAYLIGSNPNAVAVGEYDARPLDVGANSGAKTNVPYITIEQGTGNQPTFLRRPIISPEDNGAMALTALAQGVRCLGYYVFHGGINTVGALSTTEEYRALEYISRGGYFCDLAERNYDFQAPVSMYNRISGAGFEIKLWNSLASEFSDIFCKGEVTIPDGVAKDSEDLISPRYSIVRSGESGFLFYNNYVRKRTVPDKTLSGYVFETENGTITLPELKIASGDYFACPINLKYGENTLKYACATPLCILNGDTIVLFSQDGECTYESDGKVIALTKEEARKSSKISWCGKEYLVICDGEIYTLDGELLVESTDAPVLKIYPNPNSIEGYDFMGYEGDFAIYEREESDFASVGIRCTPKNRSSEWAEYDVDIAYGKKKPYDAFLMIDFAANLAEIYVDGEKLNDMLYTGETFEVSLRYYAFPKTVTVRLYPLGENDEVYLEKKPEYKDGCAMELIDVSIESISCKKLEIVN